MSLGKLLQTADWKSEKHVPVVELASPAKKGELIEINLSVGKQIAHPNTSEHHIAWIELYFQPEGEKFPYQLARFEFNSHGASAQGPNTSTVYTEPKAITSFKTEKSGQLLALSYCNIHGLWENSQEINIG